MRRLVAGLILAVTFAGAAGAETLLKLSETARVAAKPDELAATLRMETQASGPVAAQNAVNAAMAKALAAAKAAAGITASTSMYQVYQVTQPNTHWVAAQALELRGTDGDAVLGLVGVLQSQGLAVQALTWRLTPATASAAREKATAKALGRLRTRAEGAAKILGLNFERFQEVRLDGTRAQPPLPRFAGAAMAMAAPVAEAADVDVSATVEADAVLK